MNEAREDSDKRLFDEIAAIIKKKEKSPYAKLRRLYGYLCGLMLLLGLAVAVGALFTSQPPMAWLGVALLFGLPCIAHFFSLVWIDAKTPGFPLFGVTGSGRPSLLNGPYLACFGFAASGAACRVVATVPRLGLATRALPLGWLYLPILWGVAVILPFALWLALCVLAWRARRDPFGP